MNTESVASLISSSSGGRRGKTRPWLRIAAAATIVGLSVTLGYQLYKQIQSTREFLETATEGEEPTANTKTKKPKSLIWIPPSLSDLTSSNIRLVKILVLYGTEFGFSKQVATIVCEKIAELYCKTGDKKVILLPRMLDMKHYNMVEWEKENCVVAVCSTYGEGIPPNTAAPFFDYLKDRVPESCNGSLFFSVLALGDKTYSHFCRAGRMIDDLFATKFFNSERIQERVDIDRDDWRSINKWIAQLVENLDKMSPQLETLSEKDDQSDYLQNLQKDALDHQYDRNNPFYAKLLEKRQLCIDESDPNNIRECIHLSIDLSASFTPAFQGQTVAHPILSYVPGDSLGVLPENDKIIVDQICNILIEHLSVCDKNPLVKVPINYYPPNTGSSLGSPDLITLMEALTRFYDLKQVTSSMLQLLLEKQDFSGIDQSTKTKLENLVRDDLAAKSYLEERWLEDILEEFLITSRKSCNITVQDFVDRMKLMVPRYYSISSSSTLTKNETASITVSIVRYVTNNRARKGVATNFLYNSFSSSLIPIFISHNRDFRLPQDGSNAIIMVGPGTGLAPFMGFIQERITTQASGRNILFFGCRNQEKDYLYQKELETWNDSGAIELHTAFSRQDPKRKVYVQDLLSENSTTIYELLSKQKAHFYICGDGTSMCSGVLNTLKNIFVKEGGMDETKALQCLEGLEKEKRLSKDVW